MNGRTRCVPVLALLAATALLGAACVDATVRSGAGAAEEPTRGHCGEAYAQVHAAGGPGDVGFAAPSAAASAACSTMPVASGSPWPVSMRGAADAFRRFVGLSGPVEVQGPYDGLGDRAYSVFRQDGQFFLAGRVDAGTGRVTSYSRTARLNGFTAPAISRDGAVESASLFLARHSISTDGLARTVDPTMSAYAVTWERMEGDVGAYPRVRVEVDWVSGEVTYFSEERHDCPPPAAPKIGRDEAVATVVAAWTVEGAPVPVLESARLRLALDWDSGEHVDWVVTIATRDSASDPVRYVDARVNAATGQLDG